MLVEGGIFGLVLFLLPLALLCRYAWILRPVDPRFTAWYFAWIAGVAVQGMFSATIPTFNTPLGIGFACLACSPVAPWLATQRTR